MLPALPGAAADAQHRGLQRVRPPPGAGAARRADVARAAESADAARLPGGSGEECGDYVGGVPVERGPATVVADRGARVSVGGGILHVAQRHASIQCGGNMDYLYFILKKAWSVAVSASEARGPREDKERSEEKRPWSGSCRTWLKEWRISVRHDAINPGNRRASG